MNKQLKQYSIRVVPETKAVKDDQGNITTPAVYVKKASNDDLYYVLELTEKAGSIFGGSPKPFTLNLFKGNHPVHFSSMENEIKKQNGTLLDDSTLVLNELYSGRVAERGCASYYGRRKNKDGVIEIAKIQTKDRDGNLQERDMILNTVKFFLFAHEAENEGDEQLAYIREMKSHRNWMVDPNDAVTGLEQTKPEENTAEDTDKAAA
jgi:hypothetical protein